MSGQTLQQYILPLAGGVQAVFTPTELSNYRHADWLGTSRLSLDVTGNLYVARSYAPFGETYNGATGSAGLGANDRSFTGQTQDVIAGPTGVYDFLFRQQASSQGRWLVPDPAGLAAVDLTNPQTWNRYAYVGNNPMSNVDPLGLCGGSWTTWSTGSDGSLNVPGDAPCPILPLDGAPAHGFLPTYQVERHEGGYAFRTTAWGQLPSQQNDDKQSSVGPVVPFSGQSSNCDDLSKQIDELRGSVLKRLSQYNDPTWDLPLFGKMSRAGHLQAMTQDQQRLRRALNDHATNGCNGQNLSPDSWSIATMQAPPLTPSPQGLPQPPWVKYVVGGAAIGLGVCDLLAPEICLPITFSLAPVF